MKFKHLFLVVTLVFFLNVPAYAVNTVSFAHPVINISSIDSDWNDTEGRKVQYIIFHPGASDDILVIEQASATGPEIVRMKSSDGEPRVAYLGGTKVDMFLDFSDCTLTAGAKVIILLWEK
jgi:hypothetical protein